MQIANFRKRFAHAKCNQDRLKTQIFTLPELQESQRDIPLLAAPTIASLAKTL